MKSILSFLQARWGWLLALGLAAGAAGGWWWYQGVQAEQARAAQAAALRTETLGRGDLAATVSATGSLQPLRQANLAFLLPGTVQEVLVKNGDAVTAGQVLARLDAVDLQLAVSQAEDALAIAQLRRQKLLAGPSEDDIAVAKANLRAANAAAADAARGAGPQEAEIARLRYDSANENFRKLNEQYNNLVDFANRNPRFAPSAEALDNLKVNQEAAYYQAEIARLQWEQTKQADAGAVTVAYARIAQAQAQLAQLQAPLSEVQVAQADLSVAQAQLALDQARQRLARAELRAPFAGVVSVVNVRAGEPASAGSPALVLLDGGQFRLDVTVNEVDVAQLAAGQPVSVTVDALPEAPLAGQVERIAPTATVVGGAVNYTVRVLLDRTEAGLRAGMSATVQVTVAEVKDAVLAPNWAIRRDRQTGQAFVSVLDGETTKEVLVTTGLRGESYTEITAGVAPGAVAAVDTARTTPFGEGQ
ncbi:MAG: efflux RND transporter periplasmic adaptor subunit [Anaerolineales bacterium]|nr:efflux RND transporter periplasmic adaptor subunit [Anaerolineales bacterium]